MNREPEDKLAAWTEQSLRQLPPLRAPASLMPAVLAAIQRQAQLVWYHRPWLKWPRSLQILSFAVLALLMTLVGWALSHPSIANAPGALAQEAGARTGFITTLAETLGRAVVLLLRQLSTPVVAGLVAMVATAYFACVGLGTAMWRVASGRRLA